MLGDWTRLISCLRFNQHSRKMSLGRSLRTLLVDLRHTIGRSHGTLLGVFFACNWSIAGTLLVVLSADYWSFSWHTIGRSLGTLLAFLRVQLVDQRYWQLSRMLTPA
jgi:hypothetical protein